MTSPFGILPHVHAEDPSERLDETTEPRATRARRHSAANEVLAAEFPVVMRGYDRVVVDTWREEIADLIERLEQRQPREAAVKRALDEVGRETAAILQRAHEAAEEITSRSRAQADGRLRRAEGEAEIATREAEERVAHLEADALAIWEERARLIEDMRQLADEVLGVADRALDRISPPVERRPDDPLGPDAELGQPAGEGAFEEPVGEGALEAPVAEGALGEPGGEGTVDDPGGDFAVDERGGEALPPFHGDERAGEGLPFPAEQEGGQPPHTPGFEPPDPAQDAEQPTVEAPAPDELSPERRRGELP